MAPANLSYCARQMRQYDADRFLCAMFAPPEKREALFAIHAFGLELARIRELVREPLLGHMRLRWWSDALDGITRGTPPQHPVAQALSDVLQRFPIDRQPLDRLIAGRAADMDDAPPQTLDALVGYADATSASLTAAALQVLAPDDGPASESARDVGIAWALIGLVRAVPFHARARRLYLPADLCRDAGVDPARVFDRGITTGVASVCGRVAAAAQEHLQRARRQRGKVSRAALPVLLPATLADLYVSRLAAAGFDPFDPGMRRAEPWRLPRLALARLRQRF